MSGFSGHYTIKCGLRLGKGTEIERLSHYTTQLWNV